MSIEMMNTINVTINKIKNINNFNIDIPLENGIYALVGANGCGKSTIMLALSQLVGKFNLSQLTEDAYTDDSYINYIFKGLEDKWYQVNGFWKVSVHPKIEINGRYEGSLFYGSRFNDSKHVDTLIKENKINSESIVDSDAYIIENLSYILHGDFEHYKTLKRLKNKFIAKDLGLSNTPYFSVFNEKIVSQYRMSSGECLLVSLLHFIYNSIIRRSLPTNKPILLLIDEIELALHPVAITRLIDLLKSILKNTKNLTIILTSHSPEVIRSIEPENTYKINNTFGDVTVVTPCYPSYSIRELYDSNDGYDFTLLVEDKLAKIIVEKLILKNNLTVSKLIKVVPVGGWENVLQLHKDLIDNGVLGVGRKVISILDGDVVGKINKDYDAYTKLFLPVKSVEKFLLEILINKPNVSLKTKINDKYFVVESIDMVISQYLKYLRDTNSKDKNGKKLYFAIKKNLESHNISEEVFIHNLCDEIMSEINFSNFEISLTKILS